MLKNRSGFTLVELMITLVVGSLITLAMYSVYLSSQKRQTSQDRVVEMQQHIRSGMNFMVRELRMAGFDPQETADAGITVATSTGLTFTQDTNDNGTGNSPGDGDVTDSEENITYGITAGADANNDGIVDANFAPVFDADLGVASIERATNNPVSPGPFSVADNIEAIEFLYLIGDDYTPTLNPAAGELDDIRAVVVSILARVTFRDQEFLNRKVYLPASNDRNFANGEYFINSGVRWQVNDNYRRRLMISLINLRNMGL